MKKHILFLSLLFLALLRSEADSTDTHKHRFVPYYPVVKSNEVSMDTVNEQFKVHYKVYFNDTVHETVNIKIGLPQTPVSEPLPSESPQFFSFTALGNTISLANTKFDILETLSYY